MAHLPPSAVFGSARPGQAVHVLLLIENSLPMVEHWEDLQQHILPGVLGAVRIANPGITVQIFWETTGKTQDQRPAYKTQRHFNDFPDIDIVGLPRNKLSPLFIRQSIDLFLSGDNPKLPILRHVFIVAMSNPIDDLPGKSDHSHQQIQDDDAKWDALVRRLQENSVILHVIANPLVRLTRIFEVFRKTMRLQSRQEVIPWQPVDSTHCICHLSGSGKQIEKYRHSADQWPEVHLPSAGPPSPVANSPIDMSDEEIQSPISPIDMINSNPGSLSLVSRMQALHGLASRRRPSERYRRPSISPSAFFRETSPVPSPRRERLLNAKNNINITAASKEKERLRQLSAVALSPMHPPASFSSALDLRGLTQDPAFHAQYANSTAYPAVDAELDAAPNTSSPGKANVHPPSPGSDASGSTMSSSLISISSTSQRNTDLSIDGAGDSGSSHYAYVENRPTPTQPTLYPLNISRSSHSTSYRMPTGPASPTVSGAADAPPLLSPTVYQNPTHGMLSHGTYSEVPLPNFASFSSPYPMFAPVHSGIPMYMVDPDTISPPLPSVAEDDCEPEVVPASAPLDERGQVPFVFDSSYEEQSRMRLRHLIDSMHGTNGTHDPGRNVVTDLADGNWKSHGNSQTSSYIPELPDTFYSVDRGPSDEREVGGYFTNSAKQYA